MKYINPHFPRKPGFGKKYTENFELTKLIIKYLFFYQHKALKMNKLNININTKHLKALEIIYFII